VHLPHLAQPCVPSPLFLCRSAPSALTLSPCLLSAEQISTFVVNFQGRPFRENISENSALYYGLLGVAAVAFSGATDFVPEFNRWLQLVDMETSFRTKLCVVMAADFAGAWVVDIVLKSLFANNKPKEIIKRGAERREARREAEKREEELVEAVKKDQ